MELKQWILSKLESVRDSPNIIVRDPLRLMPIPNIQIDDFARQNGFTLIQGATNLVLRELLEQVKSDPETKKILAIDTAPMSRRNNPALMKAPPPFYPDLLARTPSGAQIDLSLRQYLKETTGDPMWPAASDDPQYARLIAPRLEAVIRAYDNLQTANKDRFTDSDFKKIVAFASLGVPGAAFKKLNAEDCWKIGLYGSQALEELELIDPEITGEIKRELAKQPPPFRWFIDQDPEIVTRALYLSLILSQYSDNWDLLLAKLDSSVAALGKIPKDVLEESGKRLVQLDPASADRDLQNVENSLTKDQIQFLLIDQLKITEAIGFRRAVETESYSTFIRSLALLIALENALGTKPAKEIHESISNTLYIAGRLDETKFVDSRESVSWSQLKKGYKLALEVHELITELSNTMKITRLKKPQELNYAFFYELWNKKKINRLEYYVSALERLVSNADLLPRTEESLPSQFVNALQNIRHQVRELSTVVSRQLDEVNGVFQRFVALTYKSWVSEDGEVCLTSQFLRRCLKRYWDPENEKAIVFVFDGMRYDVWDELLRPRLEDRMTVVEDTKASALLPSLTETSRWAIAAGMEPDRFWPRKAENIHLKEALSREFHYSGEVDVADIKESSTGLTVHYKAKNLDYYIFEFCDKELHDIRMKTLPDGRIVPIRPLSFIYEQQLKNLIEVEVMAIVRQLAPGTKVFVTSDHGFVNLGRERLWFNDQDLNEKSDCVYQSCMLRVPFEEADIPQKVRGNVIAFPIEQLRMPIEEQITQKSGTIFHKQYKAIVFPRVGYSFSRSGAHYSPDAYGHGGISIQELMIPMVVLRVKPQDEGLIRLETILGPDEAIEGEELEFKLRITPTKRSGDLSEIRIDVDGAYSRIPEEFQLLHQVLYVLPKGIDILYRFKTEASDEERKEAIVHRILTISVSWRDGSRVSKRVAQKSFSIKLNSEKVIRRVGNLGNILGLTPKSST